MYTPVKIKRNMRYGSNYWVGYSYKLKRHVHFYSDLEYENWILVETNPEVETFCEQPLRIQYYLDGKKSESIFDMWVKERNGAEYFVEIKYSADIEGKSKKSYRTKKQIKVQQEWCKVNSYNHQVLTEKEIRENKILLDNKRQIIPYIREFHSYNPQNYEPVVALLKNGKSKVSDLLEKLSFISKQKLYVT